jgi:hypothetical protein
VTKGVSNVTGRDDPLLQDVKEVGRTKTYSHFGAHLGEFEPLVVELPCSATKAIPGETLPGCIRHGPYSASLAKTKV